MYGVLSFYNNILSGLLYLTKTEAVCFKGQLIFDIT